MGVYIPNIEIPKSCLDCKWLESWMHTNTPTSMDKIYIEPRYFCNILRKNIDLKKSSKADECPLVEVPPHGRLIDADMLTTVTEMVNGEFKTYIEVFEVLDAPTIIESDYSLETNLNRKEN